MDYTSKRLLILLIVISTVCSLLIFPTNVKAQSKTLVVPDEYRTIQAAIDNATAGDTIYVKKGTYDGNIGISASLSLIGEDSQETIIRGHFYRFGSSQITIRAADNVRISGFSIIGNMYGVSAGSNCRIIGNNIYDGYGNSRGIQLDGDNIVVSENNITGEFYGVEISRSSNSTISNNNFSENYLGISCEQSCDNIVISSNNFVENSLGMQLFNGGPWYIYRNVINGTTQLEENGPTLEGCGIELTNNCHDAKIYQNDITGCREGIALSNFSFEKNESQVGTGNTIYHNNLIGNSQNVKVCRENPNVIDHADLKNGTDVVSWDNGMEGNYWSDYNGSGAYVIDENNVDHHPLARTVDISTIEPSTYQTLAFIAVSLIIAIVLVYLIFIRSRKSFSKAHG